MTDLSKMSDSELANWQAGWKQHTGDYILADREWERRMISHEFSLQKQLAAANRTWSVIAAIIGVIGALAGAWLGAYLQSQAQPIPQASSQSTQRQTSQSPAQSKAAFSSPSAPTKVP